MDEEKPNTIYCGEIQGSKCVCKQENSLLSAVTDYKALKRKWGTVVNKTAAFARGKLCSGKQKKMETLRYCQNVTAESYSGHPKESAAELQSHYFY